MCKGILLKQYKFLHILYFSLFYKQFLVCKNRKNPQYLLVTGFFKEFHTISLCLLHTGHSLFQSLTFLSPTNKCLLIFLSYYCHINCIIQNYEVKGAKLKYWNNCLKNIYIHLFTNRIYGLPINIAFYIYNTIVIFYICFTTVLRNLKV